jgi:RNA polymerase sigma factor (sigma-70 family)
MPTNPLNRVIQRLRADVRPNADGLTDEELLARFSRSGDEDAIDALVRRHALMVWGVCRRLLNHHDAEDAFQATFLVLVRKAAGVPRRAVANWLYGVARQTAVRLRATATKQGRRETQVVNMPEPSMPEVNDADLQKVVDEELRGLPNHYRGVVLLCDLEGRTRKEVARQLGIPEGSVASRLARARAMLAKRLTRRGIMFSGGAVAAMFSAGSASASVPPALVAFTIKAASLLAAGQAAGVVSAKVAALTEGVLKAMMISKLKITMGVLVAALAVTTLGYGMIWGGQPSEGGDKKDRPDPTPTKVVAQVEKPAENEAQEKKEAEEPFEQLRAEVIAVLGKFDSDPKNKAAAEQQLRNALATIVDKYSEKLRPDMGSKKLVSADKTFVLVIAANGRNGKGGEVSEADDAVATLVVAVGGDGSPAGVGQTASGGGLARAKAPNGVALALGGRGGAGIGRMGGGGGGGSDAKGSIGSIGLGGNGGPSGNGQEGGAGGCKIENADAIIKAVKALQKKQ